MKLQWGKRGEDLYIFLSGELDEHAVGDLRAAAESADRLIDEHAGLSRAVFNLAGLRFMDSAGIGFLLGRYKRLKRYGMAMYLESPEPSADKVLSISGLYSLMPKIEE